MPETLSYAAAALLSPPTSLVLLALAGLWATLRWRIAGTVVAALSLAALLVCSLPVTGYALLRSLETQPFDPKRATEAQVIVILGGGRNRSAIEWGGVTVSGFALQRLRYGAKLARESGLPILVTGGAPTGHGSREGHLMKDILRDEFNVPARWVDAESRTTSDNARLTAERLLPLDMKTVLLVTDAWHIRRAMPEFERAGLRPIAAPMGFLGQRAFDAWQLIPNVESLRHTNIAVREWSGILWYRWTHR